MPLRNYTVFESRRPYNCSPPYTHIGWLSDFLQRLSYCSDGMQLLSKQRAITGVMLIPRKSEYWTGVSTFGQGLMLGSFQAVGLSKRTETCCTEQSPQELGLCNCPSKPKWQPIKASSVFFLILDNAIITSNSWSSGGGCVLGFTSRGTGLT